MLERIDADVLGRAVFARRAGVDPESGLRVRHRRHLDYRPRPIVPYLDAGGARPLNRLRALIRWRDRHTLASVHVKAAIA